ncbi:unnamed protein product [Rhizoctonia solani]|uniref:Transmembrane protein n=1 Tax=Rhizoctonia solani TaxID=456999 RepID=A0A8H2XC66_9AGAM|nr:unnamed protein product [Rhizoctonia solani]
MPHRSNRQPMVLRPDVIAWVIVWVFWVAPGFVVSAPVTTSTPDSSVTSTSTPRSNPTTNPFPYSGNNDPANSSPSTTIIIVCVVGSLALLGGAWGVYSCVSAKRKPPTPTIVGSGGTNAEPTTMIYIPGEEPAVTAVPALRYNAPQAHSVDNEALEVGPGVILPPPPAYDVATAGGPLFQTGESALSPPALKRERTESMWKDLLVSQGRN